MQMHFMFHRLFAANLLEEFELDDLQEVTDAMRAKHAGGGNDPDETGRRAQVQSELFSVFDTEESKNRAKIRKERYKENERADANRRHMIGIRAPGLAVATTATVAAPLMGGRVRERVSGGNAGGSREVSPQISTTLLKELTGMGFDEDLSRKGLVRAKNDKALAIDYILSRSSKMNSFQSPKSGTYASPPDTPSPSKSSCNPCGGDGIEEDLNGNETQQVVGVASYRKSVAFNL